MTAVEILLIVSIVMQSIASGIALFLIKRTKYSALWIACIIGLMMLTVERIMQLMVFDGVEVSDLTRAWVGIIVSLSFSLCVLFARFLVNHVDRVTMHRKILEQRLMTAVLRTEERSRASFSRELHDGLGPLLSSAKMSLSLMRKAELEDKEREILTNTAAVIDEAIRSLREISNNLSPHVLNNFGLVRGIRNFVDRIGAMHASTITFNTTLRNERFDSNIEVILYRVACELINNSLKHSRCTEIVLSLRLEDDNLRLDYRDNGQGFVPRMISDSGMGLSNINSRISSLNGTFQVSSRPGQGMSAYAIVSIDSAISHLSGSDFQKLNDSNYGKKKSKNRPRR